MKKSNKLHSLRMKMLGIQMTVMLVSFIVCGIFFAVVVNMLVERYVSHDLDFLLTEVKGNLEQRIEYMESVVYAVRDSDEVMKFLKDKQTEIDRDALEAEWLRVADISGSGNQGSGGPMAEKIYLFRQDGEFLFNFYYTLLYSEINNSNTIVKKIWKAYEEDKETRRGFENSFFSTRDKTYMTCPVFDDNMTECGIIIFEINLEVVEKVMDELNNYGGVQWLLYTEKQIITGQYDIWGTECLKKFEGRQSIQRPYVQEQAGVSYRMYTADLCMGIKTALGVPENQAALLLWDSLYLYFIGIIFGLIIGLLGFVFVTVKLTWPIKEVAEKLRQVRTEGFDTKLPDYKNKEFYEISQAFNQMTEYINNLIKQVYEKQISIKEMELKFLQTQMNPHFMFNVLNSIALQAKLDGNEEICELVSTFSKLIQAKIYRSDSEKVKIKQELEYVGYYLKIQQFRYGERLLWDVHIEDEDLLELKIPKLCIQFLVENAIAHGLEPKAGAGRVDIKLMKKEDGVYIEVIDDGVGFSVDGEITLPLECGPSDDKHNHVGLNNVNHIIQLMYGELYGLKIYTKRNFGTKVNIHIPYDGQNM